MYNGAQYWIAVNELQRLWFVKYTAITNTVLGINKIRRGRKISI